MAAVDPDLLLVQTFSTSKRGNEPEENEDASSVRRFLDEDGTLGLLAAVADGASEAIFAAAWARALVQAVDGNWPGLNDVELGKRLVDIRAAFDPLAGAASAPWWILNKYRSQGSQATLLVVQVLLPLGGRGALARACAVGDSFLAILRAGGRFESFPCVTAADFGTRPQLVQSRSVPPPAFARFHARLREGDLLLIGTDAIGRWILERFESGRRDQIAGFLTECVGTEKAFARRVDQLRQGIDGTKLLNDDTTLVLCALPGTEGPADVPRALERWRSAEVAA